MNQFALLCVFVSVLQFESFVVPLMANYGKEDVPTALLSSEREQNATDYYNRVFPVKHKVW